MTIDNGYCMRADIRIEQRLADCCKSDATGASSYSFLQTKPSRNSLQLYRNHRRTDEASERSGQPTGRQRLATFDLPDSRAKAKHNVLSERKVGERIHWTMFR